MKILNIANDRRAAELAAALGRLHDAVDATTEARQKLEQQLADREVALRQAEQRAASERQTVSQNFALRKAELEAALTEEAAQRTTLERKLAEAEAADEKARQDRAADAAAAAEKFTQYEAAFTSRLHNAATTQERLERRLADTAAALTRVERQAAAEAQAAAEKAVQRQAEFDSELTRELTKRQTLAKALADAAAALQTAEQQAAAERQAAADHAARCQEGFETALKQEVARRQAVEEAFADSRAASEQVRLGLLDELAAIRQHEALLEERAARERAEWESTQIEDRQRIQQLRMEGDLARQSLAAAEEQIQRLQSVHEEERVNLERAGIAIETELARQRAEYVTLQKTLEQTRTTAELASQDRSAERVRLELLLAERDTQLQEKTVASNRDNLAIAQLRDQLKALNQELDATRSQRDSLKTTADLVPQLHKQIDDIRAEHRRRFDNTPVSMFRCSRDGAITQVNHALATLLGYDTPEDLKKVDLAATVFDSGDELQWIVDRCLASRSTESVETTWRRKDGTRVIVRVLAVATTTDSIDLAAQDVTTLREIEEKLRNSQRMEAVARYAAEVAVNCDNLLRHVKEEGEQWLARIDSDAARYQAELLLDEVTRASGFLRQLAVYGSEQKKIPELVEMNKVLRDMEPVLKRVAGDNIDLVLPKASTPLNLDVDAERVERMLVNVAAYGRERMPLGGRLMIEVASVVLDRKFIAKYPNVRPGAHVLLTVNEVRGPLRRDFLAVHTHASGANATASAVDNPGVDLGALQALVSDCGGHLWMMAEPPGDMVLKIHLPRRVLDHLDPRAAAKSPAGARWIKRLPGTWH